MFDIIDWFILNSLFLVSFSGYYIYYFLYYKNNIKASLLILLTLFFVISNSSSYFSKVYDLNNDIINSNKELTSFLKNKKEKYNYCTLKQTNNINFDYVNYMFLCEEKKLVNSYFDQEEIIMYNNLKDKQYDMIEKLNQNIK